MYRTKLINELIKNNDYKSYLEIGLNDPFLNYDNVVCENKECVDPDVFSPHAHEVLTYEMTSDEMFAQMPADKKYDFIFVDGLHEYRQVAKDIVNSFKHLNHGGIIMVHDAYPIHEEFAGDKPKGERWRWNGTVYKSVIQILDIIPIYYTTPPCDHEEGLLLMKYFEGCENIEFTPKDNVTYEYFDQHRDKFRVKPVDVVLDFFSRKEVKLFEMGHKPWDYDFKHNNRFIPLQLGSAKDFLPLSEKEGYNIMPSNPFFGEVTGLYWIWRNQADSAQYIGQTTYRRKFMIYDDFSIPDVFECGYDVILPDCIYIKETNREMYNKYHGEETLKIMEECILELYPDYKESMENVLNRKSVYNSNGFIMRAIDYDMYCRFLFSIIEKILAKMNIKTSDDMLDYVTKCFKEKKFPLWGEDELEGCIAYEKRFIGFLSERIFNIYVEHNFKRPYIIPYSKFVF